jgi:shikimate kinase
VKRVLLTGMSGVGKSTVVARLAQLGYRAIDTDECGLSVDVHSAAGRERLWREDRIQDLLSADRADVLFITGTTRNQVKFYRQFDHIVLLSAPADALGKRLATRTNNPYGRLPLEQAETLRFIETVEPLLRSRATLEIDTRVTVEQVVAAILDHVLGAVPRKYRPAADRLVGGDDAADEFPVER